MAEERSRLQKLVEEHNALQPRRQRMRAGMMMVRISQAGRYNDGDGKAADYAVGDELESHEWYVKELIASGLAEWPVVPVAEAIAVEEAEESEFAGVLPAVVVAEMEKRGFQTVADLEEVPDKELLAIPGLGQGSLRKLRALGGD